MCKQYKLYGLYKNNKEIPFYIGITENSLSKRKNDHISLAKRGGKTYCSRKILNLLKNNKKIVIKIISIHLNRKDLTTAEKKEILFWRKKKVSLTNISDGGDVGPKMFGDNNPSKRKEIKQKISFANKGNKRKDLSERNKIQSSKKVNQYTIDKKLLKVWPSVREASRQTGYGFSSIYNNCLGYSDTAFGYKWSYNSDGQKKKNKKAELPGIPNVAPDTSHDEKILGGSSKLRTINEIAAKKKVILRAPVMTQSGYGIHSRQVARWLFNQFDERDDLEVFVEPLQWGKTPWIVNPEKFDGLIGRLVQHSQTKSDEYDVSIQLQLPNEWNPFLANYNIGMTAAVEADTCSPEWVKAVNQMDMVIVPSKFVKSVLENSGEVTTQLVVIPESFPDSCLDSVLNDSLKSDANDVMDLSSLPTDFNFLVFGQFTGNNPDNDRKNLAYTLKWLSEEFKDDENVGVIIKTNFGRNTKIDKINTTQILAKLFMEVKKGPGPKFYLLHGDMKEEEVAGLYRHPKIKALVSFTRGEGFNLPALEAAACGLPVIVTNWSAHTEFLGQGKYVKVDYKLGPIHQSRIDNQIFFEGMKWAHPDEHDAKRKVKRFYRSPGIPQKWAKELAVEIQKTHRFETISTHYTDLFKDII